MALTPSALLESLLFASGGPVEKRRLEKLLGITTEMLAVATTGLRMDLSSRGLTLLETPSELELRTSAEAAPYVLKLNEAERARELGRASLEVLAVVAYQGSATRAEIDWIRGVNSTAALRVLQMRGLIDASEDDTDRRRTRYAPSIEALAHLGVADASALPNHAEFSTLLNERKNESVLGITAEPA